MKKSNIAIALGLLAPILTSKQGSKNQQSLLHKIREGEYWGSGQLSTVYADIDDDTSVLMLSLDPTKDLLVEAHKKYPKDQHIPRFEKIGTVDKIRFESYADLPSPIPFNVYKIEKLDYELESLFNYHTGEDVGSPGDTEFMNSMDELLKSFPRKVIETSVPHSWPHVPKSVLTSLKRLIKVAKSKKKYHDFTWDLAMMGTGSSGVNIRKNQGGPYKLIDLMMPKLGEEKPLSPEEIEMYHEYGPRDYMHEEITEENPFYRWDSPPLTTMPTWMKEGNLRNAYVNKVFEEAGVESLRLKQNNVPTLWQQKKMREEKK